MDKEALITLTKSEVEEVLDILYGVEDAGPVGEGWKSERVIKLIRLLQEKIGIPEKDYW